MDEGGGDGGTAQFRTGCIFCQLLALTRSVENVLGLAFTITLHYYVIGTLRRAVTSICNSKPNQS